MSKEVHKKLIFKNDKKTLRIEVKLINKTKEQRCFSVSAFCYDSLTSCSDRYLISGGQCLDIIPSFVERMTNKKEIKKLLLIYELWQKYHLNDMNADCEHAINEKAIKKIKIYSYTFKGYFNKFESACKILLKNKYLRENIKLNNQIQEILKNYRWGFETEHKLNHFPKYIKKFYEIKEIKTESTGWLRYDEKLMPSGILCKPCPICGYKYGATWNYRPIPPKDIRKILAL